MARTLQNPPQNPPLGFAAEPKPNPRINNPFHVIVVACAKTVENEDFCKKNISGPKTRKSLKINNLTPGNTQGNPRKASPCHPLDSGEK